MDRRALEISLSGMFRTLIFEIKIEIFICCVNILDLACSCKAWSEVIYDPHARSKWLIRKYGKDHSLFHSIRLGTPFLNIEVAQSLFANDAIVSRYFVQRLVMHFGELDSMLIELKLKHNIGVTETNKTKQLINQKKFPWASKLPLEIFVAILNEGYSRFGERMLVKGNDMELFHFLSAGPLVIGEAEVRLKENYKLIEDLIRNMLFIPFPPRPKLEFADTVGYLKQLQSMAHEEYPPRDGFENNRQLNVIARAILICPDLVNLWKSIGYLQICKDVNDLVLQGALLILFPPNSPDNYNQRSVKDIVDKLRQLTDLGFQLSASVMADAFHVFEDKLDIIGDILIEAFQEINQKSGSQIASECLKEIVRPEKNLKKRDVLNFMKKNVETELQVSEVITNILDHYCVGMRDSDVKELDETVGIISLKLCSLFYKWILDEFGSETEIAKKCFDNIILARAWIDMKLKEVPNQTVPKDMTSCACKEICTSYEEFCKNKVPFQSYHLEIMSRANSKEVIKPLFEHLFDALNKDEIYWGTLSNNEKEEIGRKRKNDEAYCNLKVYNLILAGWIDNLIDMHNHKIRSNENPNFREQFTKFWVTLNNAPIYNELLCTLATVGEDRLLKRCKRD